MNGNDLIYDETNVLLQKANMILVEQNINLYRALEKIANMSDNPTVEFHSIRDAVNLANEALEEYRKS